MEPKTTLRARQDAAGVVEKAMLDFLMQYGPAQNLSIGDARQIAERARSIAFDAHDSFEPR